MSIFAGEHCILRPLSAADLDALVRHLNNPRIARWLSDRVPHPYTREDGEKWLALRDTFPPLSNLAIECGGELAGGIGLKFGQDIERLGAEIGYWVAEPFWGKGIMTEALRAFVAHAFATFPLERISAKVFEGNAGSCRVLEKAGFSLEGVMRRAFIKHGVVLDGYLYAVLRSPDVVVQPAVGIGRK
jgi:RimJ/RimL family protein N-acetyltransferase